LTPLFSKVLPPVPILDDLEYLDLLKTVNKCRSSVATLPDMSPTERYLLKCYKLRDVQKAKAQWRELIKQRVAGCFKKYKLYNSEGVHVEDNIEFIKKQVVVEEG